jgi:ElaB/YqjD/DUF883 family membrane-anchored ribosome-binding protein
LDAHAIAAVVRERHGVNLDPEDPAFILVTINELVLQSTMDQLNDQVKQIIAQAQEEMERMRTHAAGELGRAVRTSAIAVRRELQADVDAAKIEAQQLVAEIHQAYSQVHVRRWIAAGIVAAAVIAFLSFLAAYAVLR